MIYCILGSGRPSAKIRAGTPLIVVSIRRLGAKPGERPPWFDSIVMTETVTDIERLADLAQRAINTHAINGVALG